MEGFPPTTPPRYGVMKVVFFTVFQLTNPHFCFKYFVIAAFLQRLCNIYVFILLHTYIKNIRVLNYSPGQDHVNLLVFVTVQVFQSPLATLVRGRQCRDDVEEHCT